MEGGGESKENAPSPLVSGYAPAERKGFFFFSFYLIKNKLIFIFVNKKHFKDYRDQAINA